MSCKCAEKIFGIGGIFRFLRLLQILNMRSEFRIISRICQKLILRRVERAYLEGLENIGGNARSICGGFVVTAENRRVL